MAGNPTITVKVKIKVECSMWDVLKLRISGAGEEIQKSIKIKLSNDEKGDFSDETLRS